MFKSLFSSKESSPYGVFLRKLLILLAFLLVLLFAYNIIHIIIALAFSAFLVMLFSPFMNWCNRHHIADWLAIILIYLFVLFLIALVAITIIPIFANQTISLMHTISSWFTSIELAYKTHGIAAFGLPGFLSSLIGDLDWNDIFTFIRSNIGSLGSSLTSNLNNIASQSVSIISSVGNVLFAVVTTFVFTFFMALERHSVRGFFYDVLPAKFSRYIESREAPIMNRLSGWLRGQLILSASVFLLVYIGLWILHAFGIVIENKLSLALIAGLLESVPYFGPMLALLPALALASSVSGVAVIAVLILYFVVQQTEGQVLVPIIMSKSLDLSPFFVLVMMAIGASSAGVLGILLAVPLSAIIEIGVIDFLKWKNK